MKCLYKDCNLEAVNNSNYCSNPTHKPVPNNVMRFASNFSIVELTSALNLAERKGQIEFVNLKAVIDKNGQKSTEAIFILSDERKAEIRLSRTHRTEHSAFIHGGKIHISIARND